MKVLPPSDDSIAEAVRVLRAGGVIAFPTETVYGLGADTFNKAGLDRIYDLKGRPSNNPLIAHVLDWQHAMPLISIDNRPASADLRQSSIVNQLIERFWPGPLTLVLPKSDRVPMRATADLATIALRSPSHPIARRLLQAFGGAISAPSANRSGRISPTSAHHVAADFSDVSDLLILDGGPCDVGIESTVVDLTSNPPRVLRPGSVTTEQLRTIVGDVESPHMNHQSASPGTALQHYAPHTPAELGDAAAIYDQLRTAKASIVVMTLSAIIIPKPHHQIQMPQSSAAYAQRLYNALREADQFRASRILIELPPQHDDLWRAIHDRLCRAASIQ